MKKGRDILHTESGIPVKLGKKLGLGYIIAAFFFLFNPDIAVIDFLPDVFGYLLICIGLSKLSLITPSLEEAAVKFKKMIFVSISKFAAILLIFGLFDQRERPYGILLFSFAFFVFFSSILGLPFCTNGINAIAILGNDSMRHTKTKYAKMRAFSAYSHIPT